MKFEKIIQRENNFGELRISKSCDMCMTILK